MKFRNPHASSSSESTTAEPVEVEESRRLRWTTNSPAREYEKRPGEVERLPDSMAALILCKTGRSLVERHQVAVEIEGEKIYFTAENSITIAAHNGTGKRVLWAYNRMRPDLLHILDDDASYVESLPRKGEGKWFSDDAASKAAIRTARGHIARDLSRLQHLHQPDTEAAARREQHNAAELKRVVSTFPTDAVRAADDAIRTAAMPKADRVAAAETNAEQQRVRVKTQAQSDRELAVPLNAFLRPAGASTAARAAIPDAEEEEADCI